MDVRDDVLAVHDKAGIASRSQCHMHNRAVFRDVDVTAARHRRNLVLQTCSFRKVEQEVLEHSKVAVNGREQTQRSKIENCRSHDNRGFRCLTMVADVTRWRE